MSVRIASWKIIDITSDVQEINEVLEENSTSDVIQEMSEPSIIAKVHRDYLLLGEDVASLMS